MRMGLNPIWGNGYLLCFVQCWVSTPADNYLTGAIMNVSLCPFCVWLSHYVRVRVCWVLGLFFWWLICYILSDVPTYSQE